MYESLKFSNSCCDLVIGQPKLLKVLFCICESVGYAGMVELLLPGIADGKWRELVYNYPVKVQNNCLTDTLAESEVKIYIKC